MIFTCGFLSSSIAASQVPDCPGWAYEDQRILFECGGFDAQYREGCSAFIEQIIKIDLKQKFSQKLVIPKNKDKTLLCEPDVEGDDTSLLYHHSIKLGLLSEVDWFDFAKNSENEHLKYAILSAHSLNANDEAFSYFLHWIKDGAGRIPEGLRLTMGFVGTDQMVGELITSIRKFGYPYFRGGTQTLSYQQHQVWGDFLCDYYPKVRSPKRLLFGIGAPDDFGVAERFDELRKVRMDVKALDACGFWF